MTHAYSVGGSRRTAVFTVIVGIHFGMFLLIASGLVPRPFEAEDHQVPEPHMPLPDFSRRDDAEPLPAAHATVPGEGVTLETRAPDLVAPRLRSHRLTALVNACYPAAARRAGEEGRVLARVLVGSDGTIVSWRIQQGSGFPRLDEAVRCIIDRLAIEPGRRNGRAVEAEAFLPVSFRLD